jgi:hypothetical protein
MIDELARLLPSFPGAKNRTRCFAHIINLVVKRILILFDDNSDHAVANTEKRLRAMVGDVDFGDDGISDEDRDVVPIDDELDEICEDDDIEAVRAVILPVRAVIAKVSRRVMPKQ